MWIRPAFVLAAMATLTIALPVKLQSSTFDSTGLASKLSVAVMDSNAPQSTTLERRGLVGTKIASAGAKIRAKVFGTVSMGDDQPRVAPGWREGWPFGVEIVKTGLSGGKISDLAKQWRETDDPEEQASLVQEARQVHKEATTRIQNRVNTIKELPSTDPKVAAAMEETLLGSLNKAWPTEFGTVPVWDTPVA